MAYRIAITSSDGNHIDQHFGKSKSFYILEIEETGEWDNIELREVDEKKVQELAKILGVKCECAGHNDAYLNYVGSLLGDCTYLLTAQIGAKPYNALQQNNINSLEAPKDLAVAIEKVNSFHLKTK